MELFISARSQNDGTEQQVRLPADGPVVLGRGPDSPVLLAGTGISRDHVRLHTEGEVVHVTDLSANGTWINGRRLTRGQSYALRTGDSVQVPGYDLEIGILNLQPAFAGAGATDQVAGESGPASPAGKLAFLAPVKRFAGSFTRLERLLVITSICSIALVAAYFSY
ncbi:MAG TPA: FHA domain-containing protein [Bryobacteraceae bacterium]|nr:FHA domain-containing protein [Bryobacteraceae bacterium]